MKCTFVQTTVFLADWADLRLGDDDLRELETEVMDALDASPVITGTGGARKIRFSPSSRASGKRGALRVIYGWFPDSSHVYLFLAYGKNRKGALSPEERAMCKEFMHRISAALRQSAEKKK